MQSITELSCSQLSTLQIITIGFVDNNTVGHFHNTPFDALQFIARTG